MSKIVSIHSFRGGTGKSNLTANVAATIASQGKRVGVVDTDITSPGIHALFGLDDEKMDKALNDYLWGTCAVEDTAYDMSGTLKIGKGDVTLMGGDVYLIPSSIRAREISKVLKQGYNVEMLNDGLRELIHKLGLDYLFIDTHPGLNEETLLSIAMSDFLLIILRPDQQDYQGTAVALEVSRKLGVPKILLVVNKVLTEFNFAEVKKRVADTYDCEVAGGLPLSKDMIRLGSAGIFCLHFPKHPLTQVIKEIAGKLE